MLSVVVVVGFSAQPALKFFVNPYFGPAKDVVVVVGVLAVVVLAILQRDSISTAGLDGWLTLMTGVLAFLYLANLNGGHQSNWANGARLVLECLMLFVAGLMVGDNGRSFRFASRLVIATGVVQSLIGLAQQYVGVDELVQTFGFAYGAQVRQDPSGNLRSFGTFDDPFNFGTVVLVAFAFALFGASRSRWRWVWIGTTAVGVVISYARTSQLTLVALILLWLVRQYGVRAVAPVAAVISALALLAGLVLGAQPTSRPIDKEGSVWNLNGRLDGWTKVLDRPENVALGNGVGARGSGLARSQDGGLISEQRRYQPGKANAETPITDSTFIDSSYLAVLSDVGAIGLLVLLLWIGRIGNLIYEQRTSSPARSGVCLSLVVVVLVDGFARSSLFAFPFGFIALLLLGLGIRAAIDSDGQLLPVAQTASNQARAYVSSA